MKIKFASNEMYMKFFGKKVLTIILFLIEKKTKKLK